MNRREFTKYLNEAQDESLYGSLAAHDRRFHPNGYQEGDSCEVWEKLDKTDKPDEDVNQDNGNPNERTTRLAPNGKRSNLTNRQYDQVRTPEFKKWFGDWENDPANASKVVDENGEPMVVYHGTRNFGFTKFNNVSDMNFGIHLGTKRSADERIPNSPRGNNIGIYVVYANIKNPLYLPDVFGSVGQVYNYIMASRRETDRGVYDNGKLYGKHELDHSGIFKDTPELKTVRDAYNAVFEMIPFNGKVGIEANKLLNDAYLKYLQSLGFDGVRYVNAIEGKGDESVIAFNSSQIKSATDNNGSFSVESDDIRDEAKGKVREYLQIVQDSVSDGPKNETLEEHREHCEAEEGNCPFEKEADKTDDLTKKEKDDKTPEQLDAEYMDAVKRGDMETAKRMVREAAAKAMPNTKVVDKDGFPLVVYRATTDDEILHVTDSNGLFMTTSKDNANEYTGKSWGNGDNKVFSLYANIVNPLVINADGSSWIEIRVPQEINAAIERNHGLWHSEGEYEGFASTGQIIEAAKENGYDGVIIKNVYDELLADDVISFKSSVVKSADPVTYDDAGNIIPLSKRFDMKNPDIRY